MKKYILLSIVFVFSTLTLHAQFQDDFEDCGGDGVPISGGHWTDWGCGGGAGCAIMCSSDQSHSGTFSGLIPDDGTTDAVLDLGGKIFGEWSLSFWQYIPSNQEAYWNLQGVVPIGAGEWIVGNFFFNQDNANPGVGLIDDAVGAPVTFTFPHDQWFRIVMIWDITAGISLATWEMWVDGNEVIPTGTPFTSADGTSPTTLGGMDLFSISSDNWYYLDDFCYTDSTNACDISILSTSDFYSKEFIASPNPVRDILNISANEEISSIAITNILGQEIYSQKIHALSSTIDMSSFAKGTYFIKALIGDTSGTIKVIK